MRLDGYRIVRGAVVAALVILWAGVVSAQGEITVTVNGVEAEPIEGEAAYQVSAYVAVADSDGQPITGLTADNFTIREDGSAVEISSVEYVERSAAIVLVLDTSGSMTRDNAMAAIREAATGFVQSLSAGDQVGVIYFNDTVVIAQNLSDDLQAAESIIGLLEAEEGAGTCLYDAAYDAVTMATGAPSGQRAVVLFTDGVDERGDSDEPCSAHVADDVITLALGGAIPVPIYTIGLGDRINLNEMTRIADSTGGQSLAAPEADDVAALFQAVAGQLKNQYEVTYRSRATSGEHELSVAVDAAGVAGVGASRFIAPAVLNLSGLDDGAILDGARPIRATVTGVTILSVAFELDGAPLSEATSEPFEVTLDSATLEAGEHELVATAALEGGSELTSTLRFQVAAPAAALPSAEGGSAASAPTGSLLAGLPGWALPVGIGGGALILVVIVAAVVLGRRRKPQIAAPGYAGASDLTTDIHFGPTLATLTVEESLSLRSGQRFDLTKDITRLGRGADNDIVVPDGPVSRHHAEIHVKAGAFQVLDRASSYGTFVNGAKVGPEGCPLCHGDALQLGTRTRMTFTTPQPVDTGSEERTIDMREGGEDDYATTDVRTDKT